jgi:co-chaperonin GroES (HSP10)
MKPQVVGHRLLVKPVALEEADPAFAAARRMGLDLSERTQRQESSIIDRGTVEQIGPTAFEDFGGEAWCKVGDLIDYVRHGGKYVLNPDNKEEKWLVLNDEDVLIVWSQND